MVRYLDKGVAETLADTLDGDLGVAVVVAVVVAHSHLHKEEIDAGVRKFALFTLLLTNLPWYSK